MKRFCLLPLATIAITVFANSTNSSLPTKENQVHNLSLTMNNYCIQKTDTLSGQLGKPTGADREPEFTQGGIQGLSRYFINNIHYPKSAKKAGIQGTVVIKFLIEKDGTINHTRVWRSVDDDLDKEAVRLVSSMPKWIPAQLNGNPVAVEYTVPIFFKLN